MRRKKKAIPATIIDCKMDLPPFGCPGIFPYDGCKNPTVHLDDIDIISCKGIVSGRVLCDFKPLQGVLVTLSSSFKGLFFENDEPVTDSDGRFSTVVTVDPGTPIINNVIITAEAVVINKAIRDAISVRVDCIPCKNPVLTLDPIKSPVTCKGTQITGRLICDGRAIGNTGILFTIESGSNRVVITPNPAITQKDGRFTATLVPFPDVNETVYITARTKIGGIHVSSEKRAVKVTCVKCKNPVIKLKKLKVIDCRAIVSGTVTCDGKPQENVSVKLNGSSILNFDPSNPVTDENGNFSSIVTVKKGTPFQTASYSATAVIDGKTISDGDTVKAGCKKCRKPELTLEIPCEPVTCKGAELKGRFTCDGLPVPHVNISFTITASTPNAVKVDPNPAVTDKDGRYTTKIRPRLGVSETILVKAVGFIGTEQVTVSKKITIDCPCCHPDIHLEKVKRLDCKGVISGKLSCEGIPLADKEVTLSSPVITFKPQVVTTDEGGEFSVIAFVPPNTPFSEVPYKATARVEGKEVSERAFVYAGCLKCESPKLTLSVPECIDCEGAVLKGTYTCNKNPVENARIEVKVTPDAGEISPDVIKTNRKGEYTAEFTPYSHVSDEVVFEVKALTDGKDVVSQSRTVKLSCTCTEPIIKLHEMKRVDCCGEISGIVHCDSEPLKGVEVSLKSPILKFEKEKVTTDGKGTFSSNVTVPHDTPPQKIPYEAEAYVQGKIISDEATLSGGCEKCKNPELFLYVPALIDCKGGSLTGEVICDEKPIQDMEVHFDVMEQPLPINPNPAITGEDGQFSADITPKHGMTEKPTIRAYILWEGSKIETEPLPLRVKCICHRKRCED
ncbi:hypothetical protein HF072_00810 [Bacillus sp. RO3]|nr:hypothetical protein [Bacillus sp. RO3]